MDTSQGENPGLWIYTINTTKGQNGGAIYLLPPYNEELQEFLRTDGEEYNMNPNPDSILIGIHTNCRLDDNLGIKLSKETGDWQQETVKLFWKGDYKDMETKLSEELKLASGCDK